MGIGEGMESIWRGTDFFLYLCILYLNAIMKKFFRSILLVLNVLVPIGNYFLRLFFHLLMLPIVAVSRCGPGL